MRNDVTVFDDGFTLKLKLHTLKATDWAEEVLIGDATWDDNLIVVDPDFCEHLFLSLKRYDLRVELKQQEV